ncbi:MAG: hypothetical protein EA408_04780 [Marinilabiliales bacterium]|nr:MAG: hypothetical protein EA408_04780 [Marinilabiliales bacterium]
MTGKIVLFAIIVLVAAGCGPRNGQQESATDDMVDRIEALESALTETERAFLDNLASLCGKSFRGGEVYMAPGRDSWAHMDFVMHVTVCEDDRVYIPFHLDEDRSRTWMFLVEERGLRFRHDHRHEDGTPEDLTMYGGYADGKGTEFMQNFPADEYTVELLEDVFNREWQIILAEDMSTMTYQLSYHGEPVFTAEFDLTNPI